MSVPSPDSVRSDESSADLLHNPLDFFRPKPSPARLIRIGGVRDGAYMVPKDFAGVTACFSPGVANRKSFEDELANTMGIRSHMLDFSSDLESFGTPLVEGLQFFDKKWLAPVDGLDSLALDTWVDQREPKSSDLILQMDIEGAEYAILAAASSSLLRRFRIVIVEFHDFRKRLMDAGTDEEFDSVVTKLNRDFVVVHARANNCVDMEPLPPNDTLIPDVVEVTMLRRDRFETLGGGRLFPVNLPHPSDIRRNSLRRPPAHLGGEWLLAPRSLSARMKVAADWVTWFFEVRVRHWPYRTRNKLLRQIRRVSNNTRSSRFSTSGEES